MDIGFLQTGKFSIPWHNECHPPFADAYQHGISKLGYSNGDASIQSRSRMENLHASVVLKKAFNGQPPELFGVIGGPPCPDFSRAGKNRGGNGKNGKLTRNFANMILQLRPKFFLLENVPGLLETKKHRSFLFSVMKKLGKSYALDFDVLDALDYGVPQNRRRFFVVGIHLDWIQQNRPDTHQDIARKSHEIITLGGSAPKGLNELSNDMSNLHWFCWPIPKFPNAKNSYSWHWGGNAPKQLRVGHHFSKINGHPNAADKFIPRSNKFTIIKAGDTSRKSFKRLHKHRYSPNVAYGNNEVHLHPSEPRRISVAEALSIQSVPNEYCFPENMTLTDKFKAVSNGVPVLLAEQVANSITQFLQEEGK